MAYDNAMSTSKTYRFRTRKRAFVFVLALMAMIYGAYDSFKKRETIVYTGRGSWMNALSPDEKGAVDVIFGVASLVVLVRLLIPLWIFRVPLVTIDPNGVRVFGWGGRRAMRWEEIRSIEFSKHVIRFRPGLSDPDQRVMAVIFASTIDQDDVIEAIHPLRHDLVPIPRSIRLVREREDREAEARAQAEERRKRGPIIIDSRTWTG
jgi:hypothetical protein